ncbi:hypothetical protein ALC56_09238 [Trachymyrmex septentrionalis]|uniref:Uncharacterized protein n=1 Tax=Trachymyrmex septentrionalis TaxID=34720 RepID=A0A195F759_9HYME|nr:hypothetical protein ALC56_09238 [Trachymyrmex septentrionalis]
MISTSTYSNKRSLSYLKYLKSYLRSTTKQKRLNYIATLYIYREMISKLNMEELINNFIKKK